MTATAHAVIGTVIAAKFGNPLLAVPIALVSHVAADLFPHWDAGTNGRNKSRKQLFYESAVDVLLGFILSYAVIFFLFPATNLVYAFIMIIVAQSLDWMTAPYYILGINSQPFIWFHKIQRQFNTKLDKPWGIIYQVAAVLFIVFLGTIF